VLTDAIDIELRNLRDRFMMVDDERSRVDRLIVEGASDDFLFIERDAERFLDARKIGQVKPVLLLAFLRRGDLDPLLDLCGPVTGAIPSSVPTTPMRTSLAFLGLLCGP
jgi:hypothetical protein